MAPPDEVLDRALTRSVRMARVANGVSRRALIRLHETELTIAAYVEQRLEALAARGIYLGKTARDRIASIVAGAVKRSKAAWREIIAMIRDELVLLGHTEAVLEAGSIARAVRGVVTPPGREVVKRLILDSPAVQGIMFREAAAGLAKGHQDAIARGLRAGVAVGEPARQVARRTFGTAAGQFLDGMTGRVKRGLERFVHDTATHAGSMARMAVYRAAPRFTQGWIYSATLDHKVCIRCASLNGRVFEVGRGPTPPIHVACRCNVSPIITGFDPPDVPNYEDWLRRQPTEIQREVLGPTRLALWKSGQVRLDRFTNDRNRILTLKELERREGLPDVSFAA